MERWYLHDIFELSMIFQDLERGFLVKFLFLANDFPIAGPITDRNSLFISQKLRFGVFTAKFK